MYQHLDAVGWHLGLRAVTFKGKQNWELEKESAQILLLEILVKKERKKKGTSVDREGRNSVDGKKELSALFV